MAYDPGQDRLAAFEALVSACEREFIGESCQDEPDEEMVAYPRSEITFGLIRRARAELTDLNMHLRSPAKP